MLDDCILLHNQSCNTSGALITEHFSSTNIFVQMTNENKDEFASMAFKTYTKRCIITKIEID